MTERLRFQGRVKWFNSQKGYGFISSDNAEGDLFVHHTAIDSKGFRFLTEGEMVEFEVETTPKGDQAIEVKRLNPPQTPEEELIAMLQAAGRRTFTILLMGRTGVGKSSTVNTLLGTQVAPVGRFEPTTIDVTAYHSEIHEVPCIVVDTPGLCDDLPEKGKDQTYLALIREKIENVDSLLFITRIDDTRVTSDEMRGISLISKALTHNVWNTAVIVFTFSDKLSHEAFDEFYSERSRLIRNEIAKHTGSEIAAKIPSVAVSNMSDKNPDGSLWLGELYTKVLVRLSKRGALPFLIATASRIIRLPIDKSITGDANTDLSSQHKSSNLSRNLTSADIIDVPYIESAYRSKELESVDPNMKANVTINNVINNITEAPPIILNTQQNAEISEHIKATLKDEIDVDRILNWASIGATAVGATMALGAAIGTAAGPVGAILGAAVGAAAGYIISLFGKNRKQH